LEGFVKVAAVSPKLFLGDIERNREVMEEIVADHKEPAIFLFPELSITGYTLGDLFYSQNLRDRVWKALWKLTRSARERVLIVGAPIWYEGRLYNCGVVLQDGMICGIVPKSYLANYREFYEKRWFSSGKGVSGALDGIPFGTDLLFRAGDLTFGIEICEDLWAVVPPSFAMVASGAELIFNLSASDELVGKQSYRRDLVAGQSARGVCGYVYASSGIGESSSDLCYSGATFIAENGLILAEGERFSFDSVVISGDIDIDRLRHTRRIETSFSDADPSDFRIVELLPLPETPVTREFDPYPFVPRRREVRDQRAQEIFAIQSTALARRVDHIGRETKLVIGLSGGLDSTLALLVSLEACRRLGKPTTDIVAISMPGLGTTGGTRESARKLAEAVGADFKEIPIGESVLRHLEAIGHDGRPDLVYENAQARERTQILMDMANMVGGIVVGTGDLSELALGFTTYNGDHMAMYNVNSGVPKTLVRHLIEWVASREPQWAPILREIIERPISPELLPADRGEISQKTEEIIGPYELLDFFLYHFVKYGARPKKILFMAERAFDGKYGREEIKGWLKLFFRRFFANQFKRNAMPDGVKVGTIALSPRGDWRMPSDGSVRLWLQELD